MKKLLAQVRNVLMQSADNKDVAVSRFLIKGIIVGVRSLAEIGPKIALSKVVQFKSRAIKIRLEEAERFIKNFSDFVVEKELAWVALAKHWNMPKSLETKKILENKTKEFEALAEKSFEDLRKNAERHNESLIFILENYDVSKLDPSRIRTIRKKLEKISKITYTSFVKEITGT